MILFWRIKMKDTPSESTPNLLREQIKHFAISSPPIGAALALMVPKHPARAYTLLGLGMFAGVVGAGMVVQDARKKQAEVESEKLTVTFNRSTLV